MRRRWIWPNAIGWQSWLPTPGRWQRSLVTRPAGVCLYRADEALAAPATSRLQITLRQLRPGHIAQLADFAHLVNVNPKIGARADQAIGVCRAEAKVGNQ